MESIYCFTERQGATWEDFVKKYVFHKMNMIYIRKYCSIWSVSANYFLRGVLLYCLSIG